MGQILTVNPDCVEGSLESPDDWRHSMKRAIRSGRELCEVLGIPSESADSRAELDFPVFVPLEYLARMRPGDASDPLLLQVLATQLETSGTGQIDPVADLASVRVAGLLQKYAGRVLLIASGACAVHCRYCFRRHFPYAPGQPEATKWQAWLEVIRNDESIEEVILSGGDPLTVSDESLARFVRELNDIAHVRRLRVHSRLPVVIPQRITAELLNWVEQCGLAVFFVLHINHVQEIDQAVSQAVRRLRAAGAILLNQAVLLAGVNDSPTAQVELCRELVNQQVLPYYLHQLDPVQGALHFEVPDDQALKIMSTLRAQLPGYAVPQLVRELPGQPGKTPVFGV